MAITLLENATSLNGYWVSELIVSVAKTLMSLYGLKWDHSFQIALQLRTSVKAYYPQTLQSSNLKSPAKLVFPCWKLSYSCQCSYALGFFACFRHMEIKCRTIFTMDTYQLFCITTFYLKTVYFSHKIFFELKLK